jgi:hypothetical protein
MTSASPRQKEYTHSLGFFLGPGRARSLIGAFGSMDGGALFRPDGAAPPLLFFASAFGGARVLPSPASAPGIGVAFDSDDLSTPSGSCIDGEASPFMVGAADADASDGVSEG